MIGRALAAVMLLAAGLAQAQQPQHPPSDLDLQSQRALAAEQQTQYLLMLLERQKAADQATAQWWADYVRGIVPEAAQK